MPHFSTMNALLSLHSGWDLVFAHERVGPSPTPATDVLLCIVQDLQVDCSGWLLRDAAQRWATISSAFVEGVDSTKPVRATRFTGVSKVIGIFATDDCLVCWNYC